MFSSSCSVYGTPHRVPVTEDAAIAPESVYAETKATVERMLRWYGVTSGLGSVSLRYFNAAGASTDGRIGEDWSYSLNLVPLAMKAVLLPDHRLRVFGADYDTPDGTCIRDYIHVEDLADAHLEALEYLAAGGSTVEVNVGTGVGSSVLDVIRTTEQVSGRQVPHDIVSKSSGWQSVVHPGCFRSRREWLFWLGKVLVRRYFRLDELCTCSSHVRREIVTVSHM